MYELNKQEMMAVIAVSIVLAAFAAFVVSLEVG
jgi:hypothetical protein